MSLDRELIQLLERTLRRSPERNRNVALIEDYYGLAGHWSPTLDDVARRHGLGTRERVRQIKDTFFLTEGSGLLNALPSAREVAGLLLRAAPKSAGLVLSELRSGGLVTAPWSSGGLLRLLQDLKLCEDVELYTWDLKSATRELATAPEGLFFVQTADFNDLKHRAHVIRHAPGKVGIALFEDAVAVSGVSIAHVPFHRSLIDAAPDSWTFPSDKGLYYLYERVLDVDGRARNPLINALQKVRAVSDACRLPDLVDAVHRSLRQKAEPDTLHYPPTEVIEHYFAHSRFLFCNEDRVHFASDLVTTELKPSEIAMKAYFDGNGGTPVQFTSLEVHLAPDHTAATIRKLRCSPILRIIERPGVPRQMFGMIGAADPLSQDREPAPANSAVQDRRRDFQERLRRLYSEGTDQDVESQGRREQWLLREWLFDGSSHGVCALCGRSFPVGALRAAHKKPREICTGAERIDLDIVMPICLFGCDYLYEHQYVFVEGASVREDRDHGTYREMAEHMRYVVGREIAPQWREPAGYFRMRA